MMAFSISAPLAKSRQFQDMPPSAFEKKFTETVFSRFYVFIFKQSNVQNMRKCFQERALSESIGFAF
jgi:hypothetical protein